jgi:ELWxxDGT repeat protein
VLGTELWRSDGTPGGTELVKDLWEGPDSGATPIQYSGIVTNGVHAYFFAEAPNDGDGTATELWRTDGTATGTVQIGISGVHSEAFCDNCNTPGIAIAGNRVFFRIWTEIALNELGSFIDDALPSTNRGSGIAAQLLVVAACLTAAASLVVRVRERRAH